MALRFRPGTDARNAGGLDVQVLPDEPPLAPDLVMVVDNPPALRAASYLNQPVQSLIVPLPADGDRWQHALMQMQSILDEWKLSPTLARRWLAAAQPVLADDDVEELYIELDPTAHLISIEIWNKNGERVFGIDDYLLAVDGLASG